MMESACHIILFFIALFQEIGFNTAHIPHDLPVSGPIDLNVTFTDIYMNNLSPWDDIFSTSGPPRTISGILHRAVYFYGKKVGASNTDSELSAASIAKAYEKASVKITPFLLGQTYGLSVARYLQSRKVLTDDNYISLASKYARFTKDSYYFGGDRSNIEAIAEGFVNFLTSLGLFTRETYFDVGLYFEHAMYYVTNTGPYNEI